MVSLPWDARKHLLYCTLIVARFLVVRDFAIFFFYNFSQFLLSNIFENISKPVGFLEKAVNTCFVENLPSF